MQYNTVKFFSLVISFFVIGLTSLNAQIGNLGIYGGAPTPASTPFTCGTPTKANLQTYPEVDEGVNITIPLNGHKNFNFFYTEDGNGFLAGGGYKVTYLNSSGTNCYGSGDIITYSPNSGHTNGAQVRAFNNSSGPYGVYGTVLAKIPGGGGTTTPLENATATLTLSALTWKEKTNGNGYVNIYYSSREPGTFLPYAGPPYDLAVSGMMSFGSLKCTYTYTNPIGPYVIWRPDDTYVNLGAVYDFGTLTLESSTSGCAP